MENEIKGITSKEQISDSTFTVKENGSWKLIADIGVIKVLSEKFKWIESSLDELSPMYDPGDSSLMFHKTRETLFLYDNKIKSVQVTIKTKLDDFNGELELVHHYIDKNNYDFLKIGRGKISLARKSDRKIKIFEEDNYSGNGWIEVKVVSDGTHFRGYINNKMIAHGHGSELKPGSVGIRIEGKGTFYLSFIDVQSLR